MGFSLIRSGVPCRCLTRLGALESLVGYCRNCRQVAATATDDERTAGLDKSDATRARFSWPEGFGSNIIIIIIIIIIGNPWQHPA
jgi:hypothetical protein